MANDTLKHPGSMIDVVLLAAATAHVPFLMGTMLVVPETDGAIGDTVACRCDGVHEIKKISAQAWANGVALYWDGTDSVTSTASTNQRIGNAAKVAANPSATGWVKLGQF